eukprot:CAMPEP_0197184494 /NCGR_PEP_ID=MMETSP1423-20130617/10007_1 /TAXON_ID=476441 /ORGANISM="Pseudo-nitzschia heimii, Strain UNC1101" /LENGTH=271 /DNA_ID=CAMNT_0042635315 /DNA_START=107 /DNA_END=922 /DNA_ORIENTATION=+
MTRGGYGSTCLSMGKMRNKQAELQRKMAIAKEQAAQREKECNAYVGKETERMTDEEIKEMNDRKRFDELLNSNPVLISGISEKGSETYLSKEQEEETIDAYQKGVDRLFEGDPAPVEVFEELVSIKSEKAIDGSTVKHLIPWLNNNKKSDFLVVISDPREKSPEFLSTVKILSIELPKDISSKMLFINADTPAQNRRFLKKNGILDLNIPLFSDERRNWMKEYTALGENRWSMTLFILADHKIQKLVREFSQISALDVVKSAVKATEKRRL